MAQATMDQEAADVRVPGKPAAGPNSSSHEVELHEEFTCPKRSIAQRARATEQVNGCAANGHQEISSRDVPLQKRISALCSHPQAFKARLCDAFGTEFFWLICAQYGLSQGAGGTFRGFASSFFYKDIKGLGPEEMQTAQAVAHMPWNVKPIYGLLSDTMPIFGFHRTYYMVAGGLLGSIGQLLLAIHGRMLSVVLAVALFTAANMSVALPDVMIDAAVAERSRLHPELVADLQSLCKGSMTFCMLLASFLKGPLLECYGPELLFALASLAPLVVAFLAWRGSLQEERVKRAPGSGCASCAARLRRQLHLFCKTIRIPAVLRPAAFMFLRVAVVPSLTGPMFFFQTSDAQGYPNFGPRFLAMLSVIGSFCTLFAIGAYNRYLSNVPLRRMFLAYGTVSFFSGLADLVLVLRWNRALGISDKVFILGDDVIFSTLDTALSMPLQVMMTRLCPATIEGTFFAMLASINNSSKDVSRYFGAWLAGALGISKDNLADLWKAVLVKQMFKLIPILLPFWLLPDVSPLKHDFLTKEETPRSSLPRWMSCWMKNRTFHSVGI